MSIQVRVSALKKQLEQLFPGKWLTGAEASTAGLETGFPQIDSGVSRGIARRRITEWVGPLSSGKTTLLRSIISRWCAAGLNVAYIDTEGKLLAADWAFVEQGGGKFWIVRPPDKNTVAAGESPCVVPLVSKRTLYVQEALWSADQFIRCQAFDVVILDLGNADPADKKRQGLTYNPVPSRIYARLQRSLSRSRAALIVVRDCASSSLPSLSSDGGWGLNARFSFDWGLSVVCEAGLSGLAMITPAIKCSVSRDGLSQTVEVNLGCSVQNRLFTHPQVPDRRTSKK